MPVGLSRLRDYRLREPQFTVAWEPRGRTFTTSLRAVLRGPKAPKGVRTYAYFRDPWETRALYKQALFTSVLWHIFALIAPFPIWQKSTAQAQLPLPRIEVTWYGPIRDLPLLNPAGLPSKPNSPGKPAKLLPRRGVDAFNRRQTIISAPRIPTHPRQTLIQPDAPPVPPKILPPMPNIVQWADALRPVKPRIQTNPSVLARLRPRRLRMRPPVEVPVPKVPNLEKRVGELNIAANPTAIPKPLLPMASASVPRTGPRQSGQEARPAPDVAPNPSSGEASLQRLIAISASPSAPIEGLPFPSGNLTSHVTISPGGPQPGVPSGSTDGTVGATAAGGGPRSPGGNAGAEGRKPGTGGGGNGGPPGISISGGSTNVASSSSGVGRPGNSSLALASSPPPKPEPRPASPNPSRTPLAPGFERIKPGTPPEEIFGPKRVYTLHVNMPNLASVTGSWVLSFAELRQDDEEQSRTVTGSGELTGPMPLRKVDPKYPPVLMSARVEGEVVLYAIIRRDGTVDSIQLVKGLDPQLDLNAMQALARWKFRPAERQGAPVELEAIVHIPFRAVAPLY